MLNEKSTPATGEINWPEGLASIEDSVDIPLSEVFSNDDEFVVKVFLPITEKLDKQLLLISLAGKRGESCEPLLQKLHTELLSLESAVPGILAERVARLTTRVDGMLEHIHRTRSHAQRVVQMMLGTVRVTEGIPVGDLYHHTTHILREGAGAFRSFSIVSSQLDGETAPVDAAFFELLPTHESPLDLKTVMMVKALLERFLPEANLQNGVLAALLVQLKAMSILG